MASDGQEPRRVVLVVGATGQQGGAVARHLLAADRPVRALTRSPGKPAARALADRGAQVVAGDLGDADSLRAALDGVAAVFCVTQFFEAGYEGEVRQGRLMVDLAEQAGVDHFVFSSVGSADRNTGIPHFDSKYEIERHLARSRLPYTVLRPVFLMENWEGRRSELMDGVLETPLSPDRPVQQVSVEDIGAFTLLALSRPAQWKGRSVDLAGDELSMTRTAEVFARVLRRAVQVRRVSWEDFRAQQGEEMYVMNRWFETTGYAADLARLRQERPGTLSLEDYLRGHRWEG
ncbi:NmrA/HSCARG family protein [Streptomyces sp. NEAU-Y11]|uniref:NmrA/HSCARG family protein n=1 Tax=Streptomyces cucumeris TaxID=2962890 RepID=UPI0020C8F49B|nr:NmrA/HSCARG family protein [Streptomyces sp. NEAU-Y11]MCP9206565.1 NmrA/HSCARG family protein [Streptomyces sp. NEAU-Y11]